MNKSLFVYYSYNYMLIFCCINFYSHNIMFYDNKMLVCYYKLSIILISIRQCECYDIAASGGYVKLLPGWCLNQNIINGCS